MWPKTPTKIWFWALEWAHSSLSAGVLDKARIKICSIVFFFKNGFLFNQNLFGASHFALYFSTFQRSLQIFQMFPLLGLQQICPKMSLFLVGFGGGLFWWVVFFFLAAYLHDGWWRGLYQNNQETMNKKYNNPMEESKKCQFMKAILGLFVFLFCA